MGYKFKALFGPPMREVEIELSEKASKELDDIEKKINFPKWFKDANVRC